MEFLDIILTEGSILLLRNYSQSLQGPFILADFTRVFYR